MGPGASSAGGIFVPIAPIGGRDEWIVCAAAGYKGIVIQVRRWNKRYERGSPTYVLFAVHIGSWLICDIFYVPPVCMLDIYSPANNNKAINKKTQIKCKINYFRLFEISLDIINFKWTSEHYLEDCLKNL